MIKRAYPYLLKAVHSSLVEFSEKCTNALIIAIIVERNKIADLRFQMKQSQQYR
jgi:hypothetical protein